MIPGYRYRYAQNPSYQTDTDIPNIPHTEPIPGSYRFFPNRYWYRVSVPGMGVIPGIGRTLLFTLGDCLIKKRTAKHHLTLSKLCVAYGDLNTFFIFFLHEYTTFLTKKHSLCSCFDRCWNAPDRQHFICLLHKIQIQRVHWDTYQPSISCPSPKRQLIKGVPKKP